MILTKFKSFEFKQHSRAPLTLGHLWQLPKQLRSSSILSSFEPRWEKVKRERAGREENKDSGVSLLPALARTFSGQLLMVAALELLTLFCWQVTGINITKVQTYSFLQARVTGGDDEDDQTCSQQVSHEMNTKLSSIFMEASLDRVGEPD